MRILESIVKRLMGEETDTFHRPRVKPARLSDPQWDDVYRGQTFLKTSCATASNMSISPFAFVGNAT